MSTQEIEVFQPGTLAFRFSAEQAKAWSQQLMEMRRAVLEEHSDYGVIPGTGNKPALFKPGAEKLTMVAGFAVHEDTRVERNPLTGEREGVTVRYTHLRPDAAARWVCGTCREEVNGVPVAQAEGYAGYDEDRYYQPTTMLEARERANATKYRRQPNPEKWAVEYRAPWNSVLKMAAKRSFVAATLNAVAGSGLFTQDVEDMTAESAPAAYDPLAHLQPWLAALTEDERKELAAWRAEAGLPSPRSMNEGQVEAVLIAIGRISAGRDAGAAVGGAAAAPGSGEGAASGAPAPAASGDEGRPFEDEPDHRGEAPAGEPTEPEPAKRRREATALLSFQVATGAMSQEDADRAWASFDDSSEGAFSAWEGRWIGVSSQTARSEAETGTGGPENAPPVPSADRERARQFHRVAGTLKIRKEDQEAILIVASGGRTAHSSELSAQELGVAETLLRQVERGEQKMELLRGAALDLTPGARAGSEVPA